MAKVQIIYWDKFPAQVQAKDDQGRVNMPLPEVFQQAIDAAAMKSGVTGTDDYLDGWRHGGWEDHPGSAPESAEAVRDQIIEAYPPRRLAELVQETGEPE